MTPHLTTTLFAGLFLTLSGMSGLTRHFLLEPKMTNYPKAPTWLLYVFFFFSAFLFFLGVRYLWTWAVEDTTTIPPGASTTMMMLSCAILIYKGSLLANVLRQRLPAGVWERLNKINARICCRGRAS